MPIRARTARFVITLFTALASLAVASASSRAGEIGESQPAGQATAGQATASNSSSNGAVGAPGQPDVEDVHCLSRCVARHKATPGALVVLRGTTLDNVSRVVFSTREGAMRTEVVYRDSSRVKTRVPPGAVSGRPAVIDTYGSRARSPVKLHVVPASEIPDAVFPIRGPHEYWDGFGAGRGHQGADVGAACGTPLVAALAGRIEHRAYQSSAGNYVVIDVKGSNVDLAYMHLNRPASVKAGQVVSAGQTLGAVGDSGNASGCHLHFEYWVGDWWGGGEPVDAIPYLKAWDRKS